MKKIILAIAITAINIYGMSPLQEEKKDSFEFEYIVKTPRIISSEKNLPRSHTYEPIMQVYTN
jgi:hypothetical protein